MNNNLEELITFMKNTKETLDLLMGKADSIINQQQSLQQQLQQTQNQLQHLILHPQLRLAQTHQRQHQKGPDVTSTSSDELHWKTSELHQVIQDMVRQSKPDSNFELAMEEFRRTTDSVIKQIQLAIGKPLQSLKPWISMPSGPFGTGSENRLPSSSTEEAMTSFLSSPSWSMPVNTT
ncbi:hypothetical protein BC941DRAFT_509398 [Chlamydoabsidia padenii]|nr:hypothetical protein BC941DRAFT_509398 [Chlamydoabsidia padenii]